MFSFKLILILICNSVIFCKNNQKRINITKSGSCYSNYFRHFLNATEVASFGNVIAANLVIFTSPYTFLTRGCGTGYSNRRFGAFPWDVIWKIKIHKLSRYYDYEVKSFTVIGKNEEGPNDEE